MWASHFVRNGNKLSISSWFGLKKKEMVGHRSSGLPECGPTESSAPEPCYSCIYNQYILLVSERFEMSRQFMNLKPFFKIISPAYAIFVKFVSK